MADKEFLYKKLEQIRNMNPGGVSWCERVQDLIEYLIDELPEEDDGK